MSSFLGFVAAAVAEIAGCYSFWVWFRSGGSAWCAVPGIILLTLFAYLLTLVDTSAAGRAYAAYGGVYVGAAVLWLWVIEGVRPDRWDLAGMALMLVGTAVILIGHRTT